jgi:hypothetical protein
MKRNSIALLVLIMLMVVPLFAMDGSEQPDSKAFQRCRDALRQLSVKSSEESFLVREALMWKHDKYSHMAEALNAKATDEDTIEKFDELKKKFLI